MKTKRVQIRQHEYAIGQSNDKSAKLVTKFISLCWGIVGIDEENEFAFICHVDNLSSISGLEDLAKDLIEIGKKTSNFRLHVTTGVGFFWRLFGLFLCVWLAWLIGSRPDGHLVLNLISAMACLLTGFYFTFSIFIAARLKLKMLGFQNPSNTPPFWVLSFGPRCGAFGISVNANIKNSFEVWRHKDDKDFDEFNSNGKFMSRMSRAKGSYSGTIKTS